MWIRKALRDLKKGVDSPLPTQAVSNEEFIPRPQSEPQKQVEQLIGEMSEARAQAAERLIRSTKSHEAPRSHTKNACLNSSYSILFRLISWIVLLYLIDALHFSAAW